MAPIPVDESKLTDVVKNDLVIKAVYNKLAALVNSIDTSDFVLETKYQTDKTKLEEKISDVTDFVKETKLTELENKIPDVSSLATKTALTAVENKIPIVSSLVKKNKITGTEKKLTDHNYGKYITTPEFNTLPASAFNARLAQANLITKTDFDAKLSSLNRKISANKTKHLLVENELKNVKKFDSGYFRGKNYFEDGAQDYLIFQPMYKYFKRIAGVGAGDYISSWKSEGMSDENITAPSAPNSFLNPSLEYLVTKPRVGFSGSCFKENAVR